MRIRRICCLNNLGSVPLSSRKKLQNNFSTPFPGNHILLKAGGNERVKAYAGSPKPCEKEANFLTYAFLEPCATCILPENWPFFRWGTNDHTAQCLTHGNAFLRLYVDYNCNKSCLGTCISRLVPPDDTVTVYIAQRGCLDPVVPG